MGTNPIFFSLLEKLKWQTSYRVTLHGYWHRSRSFYTNCNCFSVLGLLNSPFSGLLGKPPGYLPPDSMSMTADFLEKFPGVARMANRLDSCSFLDSRSSSPEDSETSGFSSGSDHLCDMLVRQITFILQLCVGLVEGEYLKPQSTLLL